MNPIMTAIRLKYQGNVLKCDIHRTRQENLDACLQALAILTGMTIEQLQDDENPDGLKAMDAEIAAYRSY